ncbi:MAG: M24 family metallopeptidase [Oscillospiraceae bacterium]|nr:M24 family metallopeptidase [Oscillospiraceae bacterium]MBQ6850473.1 M24 family metallopeptidase [Oscillospiraceae bacterium]
MKLLNKETDILPMRKQYELQDEILKDRLENLMPKLLKEQGVDMWLVICREYNEDPVYKSLTPSLVKTASRLSCLAFSIDKDGNYEAINLGRPNGRLSPYYRYAYTTKENQYDVIARVIMEKNPDKIAVNISDVSGQADGLSKCIWDNLYERLGDRLVADGNMAIRWLETRTEKEIELYPQIYRIAMDILREAYSLDVITPGVTTTTDVEYYIMQRINDMGLQAWFAPDVDVQRQGCTGQRMSDVVIEKGDIIHTDWGIEYMGLHTDSQRLGYLLKDDETEIPAGILEGLKTGNRFQDIVRDNFITGRTGNEIFAAAVEQAKAEGIRPMLYTHPIGFYGHGAGPTIGLWDNQGFVAGAGEIKLYDNTCHALELNITHSIPEWNGQDVAFYIEETITFTGGKTYFNDGYRDVMIKIG